jgi:NAD(P)-dependent dehydrogenase (short-subunit alcohol dehydrogenase family)
MGDVLGGSSAFVTGGTGPLGQATAELLARDGASVVIMGRTAETIREAAQAVCETVERPDAVVPFVGDPLRDDDVRRGLEAAHALTGRLGAAVAVIGGNIDFRPVLMMDGAHLIESIELNAVSALAVIRHATPLMVAGGGGSVVCVSSYGSHVPARFLAGYSIGKASLEALVRIAAKELAHLNVRVNAVRPGTIGDGTNVALGQSPEELETLRGRFPLGRMGSAEDVASSIHYLLSPRAHAITGQCLGVDAGQAMVGAPDYSSFARAAQGDSAIDDALAGRVPGRR